MIDELEVIKSVNNGRSEDFSILVTLYQKQLGYYLMSCCHNRTDAEDVLQETFINAYKYLKSYDDKLRFNTWLFTIAKRELYKFQHKNGIIRQDNVIDNIELYQFELNAGNIWTVIKNTVNQQTFDTLWFYYSEEFTIKEIAQILQCSQSWVKMTLFRGKRKLAKNNDVKSFFHDYIVEG